MNILHILKQKEKQLEQAMTGLHRVNDAELLHNIICESGECNRAIRYIEQVMQEQNRCPDTGLKKINRSRESFRPNYNKKVDIVQ